MTGFLLTLASCRLSAFLLQTGKFMREFLLLLRVFIVGCQRRYYVANFELLSNVLAYANNGTRQLLFVINACVTIENANEFKNMAAVSHVLTVLLQISLVFLNTFYIISAKKCADVNCKGLCFLYNFNHARNF